VTLLGCESESGGDIAIVQYQVQDQNAVGTDAERLAGFVRRAAQQGARLVVCPETPFYRYEPFEQNGVTMVDLAQSYASLRDQFAGLAREYDLSIVVGMREPGGKGTYNTAYFFGPDGSVMGYHRKAEPSLAEAAYTSTGASRATIFDTPVGRVAMAICKDVYLASVRASVAAGDVDLFLLPSADPDGRTLNLIEEACAQGGCKGIIANQQIEQGNSAVITPSGAANYLGGGENIFYTELP
jgi:predicted amidohydrolase